MKPHLPDIQLARVYALTPHPHCTRILVDRLWPRGISKSELKLDAWPKQLAPTTELRKWFNHDPERWAEFRKRYLQELREHAADVAELVTLAHQKPLLLLYAAKDEQHNHALVLRDYLLQQFS